MYRFRQAGWKVCSSPAPRSSTSAAPRTAGRLYVENLRGHLRFLAKHRGLREAERARGCCSRRCAFGPPSCARAGCTAKAHGSSPPATPGLPPPVIDYLRLAFATLFVFRPAGCGARVRAAVGVGGARLGAGGALRRVGAGLHGARARSPRARRARGDRRRGARRRRRRRGRSRRGRGPVLGARSRSRRAALARRGGRHRRRPVPRGARPEARRARRRCTCAASTSSPTAGCTPGYAFPLWHEFLALVSWFSGVDPGVVVRHEASLLAPIACAVAWEAGVAVFGSRAAGASFLTLSLAVFCFGPGHGGSWATMSLPGTAARQLLVPAAIALFFTTAGCPRPRSSERLRWCIRRMRCSRSSRSRRTPCSVSTSGDSRRRSSPLHSCRPGSRCSG